MKKILLMVLIFIIFFSFINASDSTLSNSAKRALESLGFKILSVKIADGKARGGERVMIITYYSNSDSDKHGREVILGLEMGYTLNKNTNSNLDSTMLVVGNPYNGKTRAVISCSINATKRYMMNKKKLESYIKKWHVSWQDKTFLTAIGNHNGW